MTDEFSTDMLTSSVMSEFCVALLSLLNIHAEQPSLCTCFLLDSGVHGELFWK